MKHIGIVACSAEGAALCYQTICRDALQLQLYLCGRIPYVPMLTLGVPLVRSLVWNVTSIGMLLVWSALVIR